MNMDLLSAALVGKMVVGVASIDEATEALKDVQDLVLLNAAEGNDQVELKVVGTIPTIWKAFDTIKQKFGLIDHCIVV